MYPARLALFTLLAVPALLAQSGDTRSPDGLAILQQMSEHYASASSWYIAAAEERTSENEYSRSWTKTLMVAAASGNKYHYEAHSQLGSAIHISDGKTAWDLHSEEHAYMQTAAPANGYQSPKMWSMNEQSAQLAVGLRRWFADFSKHYDSANRLADQVISRDGIDFPCFVIQVTEAQRKGQKAKGVSLDETLWIHKATWTVVKTVARQDTFLYSGSAHIPLIEETVTTFEIAELNSPIPEVLFRFEPPVDAKLVAKFSDPMSGVGMSGEPAPDVQLVAANGLRVPLSSYRGKPVLLDLWATWCAPCVASLPKLATLDKEAAPKGLVTLLVDEDEEQKTGAAFLAEHHYTWPDFEDDGKIGDAFQKIGIPLFVLIDAHGKIVFYNPGGDEAGLRKAVAGLGPEFASLAPVQKPQPCETASK